MAGQTAGCWCGLLKTSTCTAIDSPHSYTHAHTPHTLKRNALCKRQTRRHDDDDGDDDAQALQRRRSRYKDDKLAAQKRSEQICDMRFIRYDASRAATKN